LGTVSKSKLRIRTVIMDALSYGMDGKKRSPTSGAIYRLLKKLDASLGYIHDSDVDGIHKTAQTYLRLAALAMPTAAQEESIAKGLPISNNQGMGEAALAVIMNHLQERRALFAQSMQPKPIHTHVEVTNEPIDIHSLARNELAKRKSLTPPPAPGPGVVEREDGDRGPTISDIPVVENIDGTRQVQVSIKPPRGISRDELDFG
jgi:hypothetical protein